MLRSEYWISELANLSGVSTRTIRYYIQEGLLPQPEIRGKYAVFTDEYMHRLRLIKILKDAYLPLNRIKELLDTLTENEILPLLEAFEKDPVSALSGLQALPMFEQPSIHQSSPPRVAQVRERNDNALEYIQQLRSESPLNEKMNRIPRPDAHPNKRNLITAAPSPGEEWRRIVLAAGLELHVRQPESNRTQQLVEDLIDLVRNRK